MVEPLKDELLSAYLDDALSAADRDRVERHLAANPEERQLVNELRVLREALHSLPRYELPAAFRDKVLRQAEQAMLTQPVEAPVASRGPRTREWLSRSGYRTLAWPVAALAVAIMLMVVYRAPPDAERNVARFSTPPAEAVENEDGRERALPELNSWAAGEPAGDLTLPPRPDEALAREDRSIAPREPAERLSEAPAIATPAPAAGATAEPDRKLAAKGEGVVRSKSAPAPAPDGSRSSRRGLGREVDTAERFANGKAGPTARGRSHEAGFDTLDAANSRTDQPVTSKHGWQRGVLLVQVDISREAAKTDAFEKLLKRQRIVPQQQVALQPQATLHDQAGAATSNSQLGSSYGELAIRGEKSRGSEPSPPKSPDRERSRAESDAIELVYVEATEGQVQAALEDLKQRGTEFPAFAVQADPSQPQQALFARYRRGFDLPERQQDFAYYFNRMELKRDPQDARSFFGMGGGGLGGFGGYAGGEQKKGTASRMAKGGVDHRSDPVTAPAVSAGAKQEPATAGIEHAPAVPKPPSSGAAPAEGESLASQRRHLDGSEPDSDADGAAGKETEEQAAIRSRGGQRDRGAGQVGQQLRRTTEQPSNSGLRAPQAQSLAITGANGQLGKVPAAPRRGGRPGQSAAGDAGPLQIVFLLRVVGPKQTPTAAAEASVAPEPAVPAQKEPN